MNHHQDHWFHSVKNSPKVRGITVDRLFRNSTLVVIIGELFEPIWIPNYHIENSRPNFSKINWNHECSIYKYTHTRIKRSKSRGLAEKSMIEDFRFWPIRSELLLSTSQQPDSRFFPFLSRHYRSGTLDHKTLHYNNHFTSKTVRISNQTYLRKWKIIPWTVLTWTNVYLWPFGVLLVG